MTVSDSMYGAAKRCAKQTRPATVRPKHPCFSLPCHVAMVGNVLVRCPLGLHCAVMLPCTCHPSRVHAVPNLYSI